MSRVILYCHGNLARTVSLIVIGREKTYSSEIQVQSGVRRRWVKKGGK